MRLSTNTTGQRRSALRRGGYLYVAVLFTALIVAAAVAAALNLSTGSLRAENERINRKSALRLAESELHRVASHMNLASNWRLNKTSGAFSGWVVMSDDGVHNSDASQVRHRLTDADGDLGDDFADSVELTAHAIVGKAEVAVSATLQPRQATESILHYGITAYDDIQIELAGSLTSAGPIQVGDDCKTNSSGLLTTPTLECNGRVEMAFRGDFVNSATVTMPSHDVVDMYVQEGTQIAVASLPIQNGKRVVDSVLLTAADNPFGAGDPDGIYWIDASSQVIRIRNSRIGATLAIKNASSIEVAGGVVWTYANQPEAILVSDSNILFSGIAPGLDEPTLNANFNPATSPYRQTLFNTTTADYFPTELRGVVFTTANIAFDPTTDGRPMVITGAVICRDLWVNGHVAIRQLGEVLQAPPLGMIDLIPMEFVRGSFRRIPTP